MRHSELERHGDGGEQMPGVTIPTEAGITVFNGWCEESGAVTFTAEPDVRRAQQAPGLPRPSSFQRWSSACLEIDEERR